MVLEAVIRENNVECDDWKAFINYVPQGINRSILLKRKKYKTFPITIHC